MKTLLKILIFISISLSTNVFANNEWNFDSENNLKDPVILGNIDAKISIIEYRSLTCSHCADFSKNGYKHLKEKYIDTGLVNFELRPFPLNAVDLNAFKLLYCAARKDFHKLDKTLLSTQSKWIVTNDQEKVLENSTEALTKQAGLFGVTSSDFDSCLNNEKITNFILKSRIDAVKEYEVNSTPSFIINGELYAGNLSGDKIDENLACNMSSASALGSFRSIAACFENDC